MNEQILLHVGIVSAVVVSAVEAIRKHVPFDGWRVPIVAFLSSLIMTALFMRPHDVASVLDTATVALLSAIVAVGGDAWVSKIAGRFGK
jgi:hypothetical protein